MAMELKRGRAQKVSTRAEGKTGQGWCSVAYFELDGQPTRLVCAKLKPYSRSPLPPAFKEGDELIIAGWVNKETGQFNALCARLVRQGMIINQNPMTGIIVSGVGLSAIGLYPVVQILRVAVTVPLESLGPALGRDTGLIPFAIMMLVGGIVGLLLLVAGGLMLRARRMIEVAARGSN